MIKQRMQAAHIDNKNNADSEKEIQWSSKLGIGLCSRSHRGKGLYDSVREVNKVRVVMSSASSAVTYTSVYTDSEPDRAFWGADDEEVSEGGIPRVIVLGYDGLPIQPVAPPSPDYIPGPEDPQTLPVP
ncbi:hypothetical protein Tco_0872560 [Tanacetum coccineum]